MSSFLFLQYNSFDLTTQFSDVSPTIISCLSFAPNLANSSALSFPLLPTCSLTCKIVKTLSGACSVILFFVFLKMFWKNSCKKFLRKNFCEKFLWKNFCEKISWKNFSKKFQNDRVWISWKKFLNEKKKISSKNFCKKFLNVWF